MRSSYRFAIALAFLLSNGFAHADWVPVATVSETTTGHLCDVDDNGLDLYCSTGNPELLTGGVISATGISVTGAISTSELWVNGVSITGGGGASSLDGLTDVSITTPANASFLRYDDANSQWVDIALQDAISSTTIKTNWPDAIHCTGADGDTTHLFGSATSSTITYYSIISTSFYLQYNTDGSYNDGGNVSIDLNSNCFNKSISTLYAEGSAFNLVGGGNVWTQAGSLAHYMAGNVGVGTTTPQTELEVNGTISTTALVVNGVSITGSGGGGASSINELTDAAHDVTNTNIFLGQTGGSFGANDQRNLAIGATALDALNNSTATDNVAVGDDALTNNISGDGNTALGVGALREATANYNTAVGHLAGQFSASTTTSDQLSVFGYQAGYSNAGDNVTALGGQAGQENSGNNFVGVGYLSGFQNSQANVTALGTQAGQTNTGTDLTAIGYLAGDSNSGSYGTAIGSQALFGNTGTQSNAIGGFAGYNNTGNDLNAQGYQAGYQNVGDNLTVVGSLAGYQNSATDVTGVGYQTAYNNVAEDTTAIGARAGYANAGSFSTVIGSNAGYENTGGYLTAIGALAGERQGGDHATGIGFSAAFQNSGSRIVGIGYEAARNNTGNDGVFLGYEAGEGNTANNQFILKQNNVNTTALVQGDFSTGLLEVPGTISTSTLLVNGVSITGGGGGASEINDLTDGFTDGNNNLGLGSSALSSMNTGNGNVAVGESALDQYVSISSTAVGYQAGLNVVGSATDNAHSLLGYQAGIDMSGANSVVAIGNQAGAENSGDDLVAIGLQAGFQNSGGQVFALGQDTATRNTGVDVIAVGRVTAQDNTGDNVIAFGEDTARLNEGNQVIAFGENAARENSGNNIVAFGLGSLRNNASDNAVAIGYETLYNISASNTVALGYRAGSNASVQYISNSVFIGHQAGRQIQTGGNNNTFVGYQAGESVTTGSNNLLIGYNAQAADPTGDYQLNIADTLYGDINSGFVGVATNNPQTELEVAGVISATGISVTGAISTTELWVNGVSITGGGGGADDMGNHTASQTIVLSDNFISNDGDAEGISIDNTGNVSMTAALEVSGTVKLSGTGSEPCGTGDEGIIRRNPSTGAFQICR